MASEELKRWIDALDGLPDDQRPTRDAMRAVARDIGLDEDVLERAETESEGLRIQGQRFLDEGLFDDAVRTLDEALGLQPWSDAVRTELAEALLVRHQHRPTDVDAERVERLARQLIRADPEADAGYALLKGLSTPSSSVAPARGVPVPVAIAGMVGGAVVLAGIGLFATGALWEPPTAEPSTAEPSTAESPTMPKEAPASTASAPPRRIGDLDVAIQRAELPDALHLEVTSVDLVPAVSGVSTTALSGLGLLPLAVLAPWSSGPAPTSSPTRCSRCPRFCASTERAARFR